MWKIVKYICKSLFKPSIIKPSKSINQTSKNVKENLIFELSLLYENLRDKELFQTLVKQKALQLIERS